MSDHADIVREAVSAEPIEVYRNAALAALDRLTERVALLVAEAHGWQPRLQAAEAQRDRYWNDTKDQIARAEAAEAEVARLREALGVVEDYYEAVYAPGDQAYQAAIVARAALAAPTDRLSLQQQISELVRTARAEQVRADTAEADAEVRKRLYEASVKDRVRLREALRQIAAPKDHKHGDEHPSAIARAALADKEDTDE